MTLNQREWSLVWTALKYRSSMLRVLASESQSISQVQRYAWFKEAQDYDDIAARWFARRVDHPTERLADAVRDAMGRG